MKTKALTVLIFLFITTNGFAREYHAPADSTLYHAQEKIYNAFMSCFQEHNMDKLEAIETKLRGIDQKNRIVQYWIAYTQYYESIYQIKMGNNEASLKEINEGIETLQEIKNKSSEDYALLSMMQGYAVQFSKGMSAGVLASKAKRNAEKAVDMDKENIRAWYVLANNDYYTPKEFGGGKKVEESLKKAIALEEKNSTNPYLPTWGKKQSYGLLVGYYIDNECFSRAKTVLDNALKKYPDDYMLQQYEDTLADK